MNVRVLCWYREQSGGPSSSRSPHPGRWTTRSRQNPRAAPPGGTGPTHTCTQSTHSLSSTTWGRDSVSTTCRPCYKCMEFIRSSCSYLICKSLSYSQTFNKTVKGHSLTPIYSFIYKNQRSNHHWILNIFMRPHWWAAPSILFNSLAVLHFKGFLRGNRICNNVATWLSYSKCCSKYSTDILPSFTQI